MAIDRSVSHVSKKLRGIPWKGKIVTVKEGTVYVNSGSNAGLKSGDTFSVYRQGESLIDPDTGMDLGSEDTKVAEIKITEVQEKFSKATATFGSADVIGKGDLVLQ